jgi:hypothetical protein
MKFANATNLDREFRGSVVEGPAVSFCPSDLTAPNKSHALPFVIPSEAEFPATLLRNTSTCAVFRRRKPHEARQRQQYQQEIRQSEGSAVRPGSRPKVWVSLVHTLS